MKIIKNNIFPFGSYTAINLFGIVFYKGTMTSRTYNHELIHSLQMREMLFVFFYLWYFVEWLVKLIRYRNWNKAYNAISFEREAYQNDWDDNYKDNRRKYSWFKFVCSQ
jgi:hypothetical protein